MAKISMKGIMDTMDKLYSTPLNKSFDAFLTKDGERLNNSKKEKV